MFEARCPPVLSQEGQSGVVMQQPKFGCLWVGGDLVQSQGGSVPGLCMSRGSTSLQKVLGLTVL